MVNDRWCVTLLPITVFDGPSWFWHMPGAHHQHLRISIQRSAVHLSVYSLCTKHLDIQAKEEVINCITSAPSFAV